MVPAGYHWEPSDEKYRKEYEDNCFDAANKSVGEAQDALYSCAPFIPEDYFNGYESVLNKCKEQINVVAFRYSKSSIGDSRKGFNLRPDDYKRTIEINEQWRKHNETIRDYLSGLDIVD